ncbi:hypothetical protein GJ496_009261 [Pomphorhynchus laevis]|nr:hypothetical protein GJ496_009261 [Pomphorhynchus laevis]
MRIMIGIFHLSIYRNKCNRVVVFDKLNYVTEALTQLNAGGYTKITVKDHNHVHLLTVNLGKVVKVHKTMQYISKRLLSVITIQRLKCFQDDFIINWFRCLWIFHFI